MPPVDARELVAIFAGGFLGTIARAALVGVAHTAPGRWPWATFAVNVLGAFLLGFVITRPPERMPLSPYRRGLLGTGFCGALTTFSTLQIELLEMLDRGRTWLALAYVAASVAAGLLAVVLATRLVRRARMVI